MTRKIKVQGKFITQPGMVIEITHETPTRQTGTVVDLFFPVHDTARFDKFQIDPDRQAWLREHLIGQTRTFWKTGTRAGFEVGGDHKVIEHHV